MWRALTEPAALARWWAGGDPARCEVDLQVGGRWRAVVDGDGYTLAFHGVYREIVPGARLVCTEVVEGEPTASLLTYSFAADGAGCAVGLWTELPLREDRDALLDSGMAEGLWARWGLWERVAAG